MVSFRMFALACTMCACLALAQTDTSTWKFAVSGDSRNCGDIVMPAIAAAVRLNKPQFYWHLGDFRAIYTFDEDFRTPANISDYEARAWPDFIEHQLERFGKIPVFLGIGNHETIPPATRESYLIQFADWLDTPVLRDQRLKDNEDDHKLRTYYHWVNRGIDFINLDNASTEQFTDAQLKWFNELIERDEASTDIRTIVVGMHEALPGSVAEGHSMGSWAQGQQSGRLVYEKLWHAQSSAHKRVYILASHWHIYMEDVYDTPAWKDRVIPGWIVGTAGAQRYAPPAGVGPNQKTRANVYGYLIATVSADDAIDFSFHEVSQDDLFRANEGFYPETLVKWCFSQNKQVPAH